MVVESKGFVKIKDILRSKIITSNLSRSEKTSQRTYFNFNDIDYEKDRLEEKYPPIVDLGKGGPSYLPAETILDALEIVAANRTDPGSFENHQYTKITGHPRLHRIISKFYSPLMKRDLDPYREVLITSGSTNSLDLAARSFVNPGDEVIVFEPFYFQYRGEINLSGGKIVPVPLHIKKGAAGNITSDWTFNKRELESKITKKTKMIWLNNPNNPLGKVYTLEELTSIGDLAKKYDLLILADEAAQWYQYDGSVHTRIGSLPGLFKRTITLVSGGKMFTNTGWRVGWVIGPERLLWPMSVIFSYELLSGPTPLQLAFAIGMETELKRLKTHDSYFNQLRVMTTTARNRLISILRSVGAEVITPNAGYCVVADFKKIINQIDLSSQKDPRPGYPLFKYMLIEKDLAED